MDFNREVLVAAAVGEMTNVNTPVRIVRVRDLVTYIDIGVNMPDCPRPRAYSYPFVLIAVPKPSTRDAAWGHFHQNYGNGCASVLSGTPHDGGS